MKRNDISRVMEREQLCSEHAAVCFLDAKRRDREKAKYARDVLAAFDDLEHADKRDVLEKRSEIERKSRASL